MMAWFQTVRPLKSARVKKILADEELRVKFIAAVKDLREGKEAIFIAPAEHGLRQKYLSVLGKDEKSGAVTIPGNTISFKLAHVKEIAVGKNGELLNEGGF